MASYANAHAATDCDEVSDVRILRRKIRIVARRADDLAADVALRALGLGGVVEPAVIASIALLPAAGGGWVRRGARRLDLRVAAEARRRLSGHDSPGIATRIVTEVLDIVAMVAGQVHLQLSVAVAAILESEYFPLVVTNLEDMAAGLDVSPPKQRFPVSETARPI